MVYWVIIEEFLLSRVGGLKYFYFLLDYTKFFDMKGVCMLSFLENASTHAKHGSVLNIAHRGSRLRAPENTIAACKLALEEGADGVEVDARLTKDGFVVLMHDETLVRTTDGSGSVSEKTLTEVKALDAGSWDDRRSRGERVPTLYGLFSVLPAGTLINVELKRGPYDRELVRKVIGIVRIHQAEDRAILSSFDLGILRLVKQQAPDLFTALIYPKNPGKRLAVSLVEAAHANADAAVVEFENFTARTIGDFAKKGKEVISGALNDVLAMRRIIDFGASCIITDDPLVLANMLARN